MPIRYKINCDNCGKYYESFGKYFCTQKCRSIYLWRHGLFKGNTGHEAWNKGTKGVTKPNQTSFKKGQMLQWKTGKIITSQGYISLWIAPRKRELEHRIVAEKMIGRKIKTSESVHHINGIRTDNRPENIVVISKSEHNRFHANQRWHPSK